MLVLTRKIYFKKEKRGRDTPLINTSGTEARPKFCHSVIVAGLERIEIQSFLRRKTKHLYKRLVLVFSLRVGFQARVFSVQHDPVGCWTPRDNDNVVGPRIFLISCGKVYPPALF